MRQLGDWPCERNTHSATVIGNKLYIFGGRNEFEFFNDVWTYDLSAHTFSQMYFAKDMAIPLPRSGHSACALGDRIFVFGGWSGGAARFGDFWMLNVSDCTWQKMPLRGNFPTERSGHTGCTINEEEFVLFGGWGKGSYKNELHAFNEKTGEWRLMDPSGQTPGQRRFHGMCVVNNYLFVYGGKDGRTMYRDTSRLLLGPLPLERLCCFVVLRNFRKFAAADKICLLPPFMQERIAQLVKEEEEEIMLEHPD
eukprot:TRINITY_DN4437_c0_g1_i1.p1 TRINITY_DN4437_c0_g1~~TRINITY_DN4437_c0_g1_i1.p1  ORF type:complete len:252 (+),score=35.33 TRINITY_DN4437_c0_g1_i1:252-1007(+)